ncbi:MAG: DNA (cytosine-5-)-methyltransferase [Candidatus Paceibacterota bacterium]|jgi:DNA (cytosine-5)-methyltransferase 1
MKTETNIQTEPTKNQSDNFYRFDAVVGLPTFSFRHLDLFSGIGGFALAAKSIWKERYENVGFCEIDKYCQKVLRKNFGNDIKMFEDIHNLRKEDVIGTVDLITGGFPCQPFSIAGKRKGASDDRYLWDEMFRVIREIQPRWIVGENVANLWNMGLENMLSQVEGEGYEIETFIIPACAVNAPHKRDRIWIIAHANKFGCDNEQKENREINKNKKRNLPAKEQKRVAKQCGIVQYDSNVADTESSRREKRRSSRTRRIGFSNNDKIITNTHNTETARQRRNSREILSFAESERFNANWNEPWYEVATRFCRVDDGIPNRVDRLKGLGNAIVPQIAMVLLAALKATDDKLELKR